MTRKNWPPIVTHAAAIVNSYSTPVTLRQLFYRLVSDGTLANSLGDYKTLSSTTAQARREGWFPTLLDMTRTTEVAPSWSSPKAFIDSVIPQYARDHTEGQETMLVLGAEKATLKAQLEHWFGHLHVPTVVLRGYSSQTYTDDVRDMVISDGRPGVLLYVGDLDPSGEDIDRDFVARTDCWKHVERIAVKGPHVTTYGLTKQPGKAKDARAAAFVAKHGSLYQVEVEALDPNDLKTLVETAVNGWWNDDAYDACLTQEKKDRKELRKRFS